MFPESDLLTKKERENMTKQKMFECILLCVKSELLNDKVYIVCLTM